MIRHLSSRTTGRLCLFALAVSTASVAFGDTNFTVRRMTRTDVPRGEGQCDIRLQIDDRAEVEVRGDQVFIRELSGAGSRDDGSECNLPLPTRVDDLRFEVKDARSGGDIRMLAEPSGRSRGATVVSINDPKGGPGRYHFRLTWSDRGNGRYTDRSNDRDGYNFPNLGTGGTGVRRDRDGDGYPDRPGVRRDRDGNGIPDRRETQLGNIDLRNRTVVGTGSMRVFGRDDRLRQARLDLRRNGEFVMSFDGNGSRTVGGRWIEGRSNDIELEVLDVDRSQATGRGRIYLRNGQADRIELNGRETRNNEPFDVTFTVR